jgi:hypothetical protein
MVLRKGQALCDWILSKGWSNETVHQKLFHMTDKEFDEALAGKVCENCKHWKYGEWEANYFCHCREKVTGNPCRFFRVK